MCDGKGVNQYTGAVEDDTNDDLDLAQEVGDDPIHDKDKLPEDRFHQADIVSQHMIDTREKQRLEKVRISFSTSFVGQHVSNSKSALACTACQRRGAEWVSLEL